MRPRSVNWRNGSWPSRLITLAAIFVLAGVLPFACGLTFEQRCAQAGFRGAEHERCVLRLNAGKPLYPQNEGYRP